MIWKTERGTGRPAPREWFAGANYRQKQSLLHSQFRRHRLVARTLNQQNVVVRPTIFLKAINRVRRHFTDRASTDPTTLRGTLPADLFAATVASLVNRGVIRWSHDDMLTRADVPDGARPRRTA
jgi:hypothetical protein